MKNLKCIYLDMDGVIVNMLEGVCDLYGYTSAQYDEVYARVDGWDAIPKAMNEVNAKHGGDLLLRELDSRMLWQDIAQHGDAFWADLEWTPYGKLIFQVCQEAGPVVLMSTPTREPSSAAGKMAWINREMPKDWRRRYAFTPCKHHMAHEGAILIDDSPKNVALFEEHGGNAFLWPQPWNASHVDHAAACEALQARLAGASG